MRKYNNFNSYKNSKNYQRKKTPNSSWISFNENQEAIKKEYLLLTNINKSSCRI